MSSLKLAPASVNTSTNDNYKLPKTINHSNNIPKILKLGASTFDCSYSIARAFNNFFASVFSSSTGCFNNFADGVLNSITLSIYVVKDALSKVSLGTGIDHIPGFLLFFAVGDRDFHVYKLFEGMLSSAVYPEQ